MITQPIIPKEVQNKVRRGQSGKWIFCLAEYNHRKWPGKFRLVEITRYTNEASARLYFSAHLEAGNHFLLKVPEQIALVMKHKTEEGEI